MNNEEWRKCAICKKAINYGAIYQQCSVSTCKKHSYCSVSCWDSHVPIMNHKSAWAEEERAPRFETSASPVRRVIVSTSQSVSKDVSGDADILIVASKLKAYIKNKADMNVSANVLEALSDIVRQKADDAIYKAKKEGRKTVMNKDFF